MAEVVAVQYWLRHANNLPADPATGRQRSAGVRRAFAVVALAALCLAGAGVSTPVASQERDSTPGLALRALGPQFGPNHPLTLELEVSGTADETMDNLRVTVALYERTRSRSQLQSVFEGRLPRTPLEAVTYRVDDVGPEGSETIRVELELEELPAFHDAPDGVYPVSISLRESTGPALQLITTAVALITEPPTNPLEVVPVLALVPRPMLAPDGQARPVADETLVALRRELAGLADPGVPFGLAVSPLLLDELGRLTPSPLQTRAQAAEDALSVAASRAELLTVPYTQALLPHLPELAGGAGIGHQLSAGRATTRRVLGVDPQPILYPPGLSLDSGSVASAGEYGIVASLTSGSSLARGARGLTPADPTLLRGVTLIPADTRLREHLSRGPAHLELSRAMAETAMIHFESPARQRTISVTVIAGSRTTGFPSFLAQIRDAAWIRPVWPSAVAELEPRTTSTPAFDRVSRPPDAFVRTLAESRRAVHELTQFTLEGNEQLAALGTALDVSLGTAWWERDWAAGVRWNRAVSDTVRGQRRLIGTDSSAPVTFTSRQGQVPISIFNQTGYAVRLRVEISSPKLRFPDGSVRIVDPLHPPGAVITFPALADATGTFPLTVRISSDDGGILLDEEELVVRSTAYNVVAIALTVGAALFLVGSYVWRVLARRRAAAPHLPA